ncbi:MAG: class A beta-lactamase-related serine hydrolase, partial [Pedobacter sp.]
YKTVGVSIAVIKGDKIAFSKSYGLKNIERNELLNEQSIFRIASISKSFSATSIMQLVEAGKVKLSDDFGDLMGFKIRNPKYPNKVITLKMVMSHTSGINDSQGYLSLNVINPDKNPDWAKCYSDNEPGSTYDYCNLNYNMIGTLIEKISGERFDQYVKRHILNPLKLYGGYCVDSLDNARFASLYEYNAATNVFTEATQAYAPRREEISKYVMGYSTPIFSPTGGMKISAVDLAKYMKMHMNFGKSDGLTIISKKSAKLMQTKVSEPEEYGLALRKSSTLIPGVELTGHTGSAYGLYSTMFFSSKEKFGIVIITNGCNPTYTDGMPDFSRAAINCVYNNLVK